MEVLQRAVEPLLPILNFHSTDMESDSMCPNITVYKPLLIEYTHIPHINTYRLTCTSLFLQFRLLLCLCVGVSACLSVECVCVRKGDLKICDCL